MTKAIPPHVLKHVRENNTEVLSLMGKKGGEVAGQKAHRAAENRRRQEARVEERIAAEKELQRRMGID